MPLVQPTSVLSATSSVFKESFKILSPRLVRVTANKVKQQLFNHKQVENKHDSAFSGDSTPPTLLIQNHTPPDAVLVTFDGNVAEKMTPLDGAYFRGGPEAQAIHEIESLDEP